MNPNNNSLGSIQLNGKTNDVFVFPMSSSQKRLWFIEELNPSTVYNLPSALDIKGPINLGALERSIQHVIERHEILRTTFAQNEDELVQIIHPTVEMKMSIIEVQEQELDSLLKEEVSKAFDLTKGPLFRAMIFRVNSNHNVLFWNMHHIISDGWSMKVLHDEISAFYAAYSKGETLDLSELTLQYADFSEWHNDWLEGEEAQEQLEFWKKKLGGDLPVLQLHTDYPRPVNQTFRGSQESITIPQELINKLEHLSETENATMFTLFLAAYNVLLYRYTFQKDILIGTPIAGRNQKETEDLIGFFVNTLVLRLNVTEKSTFRDVMVESRRVAYEAFDNQDIPFDKVVEEVQPQRNSGYSPLFQVMLDYQNSTIKPLELEGVMLTPRNLEFSTAKFDLILSIANDQNGLLATFEYNTDLFMNETISRMANHFLNLLKSVAQYPDQEISRLCMLSENETNQILLEWNDTATEFPRNKCIQDEFEQQVALNPDAIALRYQDKTLTYNELNKRANQIAHYLKENGVQPECLVGLCVKRSIEMITSMLGIIKAGGVYVPLDASYPEERLRYIFDDAKVTFLITEDDMVHKLPFYNDGFTLKIDTEWDKVSECSESNPVHELNSDSPAYVNYTSGSTGKPKGVVIPHRGVLRLVKNSNYVSLSNKETLLQFATISFDAATFEIWGSLLNGAKLVIYPYALTSLEELGQSIQHYQITTLLLTTGLFHQMVDYHLDDLKGVGQLFTGGDVLSTSHARKVLENLNDCRLINAYGPTESTTIACFYPMDRVDQISKTVPIGKPISNTEVYILDDWYQPVPIGVPGELYIGGDGLALEYLGRKDLTEERFIPNPFNDASTSRIYKTGDLVRYLADGNIEFLGRTDKQVKIRGFRIELGEIEAVLKNYPDVEDAVVTVQENTSGDKRLIGYVVTAEKREASIKHLLSYLKENVPEYMIPLIVLTNESLPLTLNGKVDYKALSALEINVEESEDDILPHTDVEKKIVEVWQTVLGINRIGMYDNFFELGGHSLVATRVISRLRKEFDIQIDVRHIFNYPTITELATFVEGQIDQISKKSNWDLEGIRTIERHNNLPLSFAQQRLWFVDQLSDINHLYSIPLVYNVQGNLNVEVLQQSLSRIVDRHESLRTIFKDIDGTPVQLINSKTELNINIIDLSDNLTDERDTIAHTILRKEARHKFELSEGPLFRVSLIKLETEKYILLLNLHHIVSDAWSNEILLQELAVLYDSILHGRTAPLNDLPYQYVDFSVWQRELMHGSKLHEEMAYWKTQLGGELPVLQLPTDRPRSKNQTFRGKNKRFQLSDELYKELKQLSQHTGTSLNMTLLAAFKVLLHRYTGQNDILIGSPISGRNYEGVEKMIGFFVNTLVFRTNISSEQSFGEFLQHVREVSLDAFSNQNVPFEKLVEEIQPNRDTSTSPLFQVMFSMLNSSAPALALSGLVLEPVDLEADVAKYELSLAITENENKIEASFDYNIDLFDDETISRMTQHYLTILNGIVSNPNCMIGELPILTEIEKQKFLVDWNIREEAKVTYESLADLFESRVEHSPDTLAVVYGNRQLTYHELNERANQLANHLHKFGVRDNQLVGIMVERSLEMIVGILAILKAGGAYLPIEPNLPKERIQYMLNDSEVQLLLTQKNWQDDFLFSGDTIDLEDERIYQGNANNPAPMNRLSNYAYVIYTSGSTGKPKGVMVTQRNVLHILNVLGQLYPFGSNDVYLLKTPFTFDVSVSEIFGWISGGGKLAILKPQDEKDPLRLFEAIKDYKVTHVNFVPSMLHSFLERLKDKTQEKLPALRYVFSAGEALQKESAKMFFEVLQGVELVNLYGPTEITIYATNYSVKEELPKSSIPIGRPLPNTTAYVVNGKLQMQPLGVPGELCISGLGLTEGYINKQALTEEKFVYAPWNPTERMYRTGDLVRWLPNGDLEYLGRIDDQIKLRGIRIELGEIQSVLESHPLIRECVVLVKEDHKHDQRLVAYIVLKQGESFNSGEIRQFLRKILPEYMVPSTLINLNEIPLSPNGKIDRAALPNPKSEDVVGNSEFTSPQNPMEEILAGIWSQVLGLERVGIHDNFFELGGHSLLAIQVLSRLRNAVGAEVPVQSIFNYPTIFEFASQIDMSKKTANEISIQAISREQKLPMSSSQNRLWFLNEMESKNKYVYNIPLALRLSGELERSILEKVLNTIISRHESLRTTFRGDGDQIEQVIAPRKEIKISFIDHADETLEDQETELKRLIRAEVMNEFDLSQGPLFRASIIRLQPDEHILLLNLHHIISDGWSQDILLREISTLYRAHLQNEIVELPKLPIQYADYAAWQKEWIKNEEITKQINYWKQQLQDQPLLLQLPTDRQRPSVQTYAGDIFRFEIPERVAGLLKELSVREGTTLYMTLLAAFKVLLFRYSDQEDVSVGSPVTNRNHQDLENLIGLFVNTLVLRTQIKREMSYLELLKQVRKVALEAYANQDVPFEKIVEELRVERDLSHSPLFQVMFIIQNISNKKMEIIGLNIEEIEIDTNSSKYDLTLFIAEENNRLTAVFEFNTDMFEKNTVARMADSFNALLEGIIDQPELSIGRLPVLPFKEQQKLLVDWNLTSKDYTLDKGMHLFFEEQVEQTPEAIAAVFDKDSLSYKILNSRANQLARHLQSIGVKPGVLVGVYMERSLEMLVSLLAIFKAGGAYVPLDPSFPTERISFMLQDSKTNVILTTTGLEKRISEHKAQIVYVDRDWSQICYQDDSNLKCYRPQDSLVYTIYTSGSTGKPKGVQIRSEALTNYLLATNEHLQLQNTDRFLAVTTISFDIAGMELYLPLMQGACVVIASRDEVTDGERLAELLITSEATVMQATPATWQMLIQAGWSGNRQLKVLTGGEALPLSLANQLLNRSAGVWNFYGPTETTIYSAISKVESGRNWVSIGRPIANTSLYVLDHQFQLVPVGVPGELYIGGEGLAVGYLNRPELTQEKFLEDPFSNRSSARMYRTGDLVRYRENGELEFISRIDNQVKVRGFRIELGEIENVLLAHTGIKEAVVVVREDVLNDKRLVAYIKAEEGSELDYQSLRNLLKRSLPDYMIPSAIIMMDKFPLTPNGKIDRRALDGQHGLELSPQNKSEAPRTMMEKQLADMWCDILRIDQVSIHDNFFEIGGHSLLATQLISRIRKELKIEIPLRSLFENPSIASLSTEIAEIDVDDPILQLPESLLRSDQETLQLSFAQQRLWFLNELESNSAFYNVPIAFYLRGKLNIPALEKAFHDIISRHEILRTTFAKVDGEALQHVHSEMDLNINLLDFESFSDIEQEIQIHSFIEQDSKKSFDLSTGPLLRVTIIRSKPDQHVLLLTVHHIIFDVWSLDVFAKDLAVHYEARANNKHDFYLPDLTVQYADFANWQRKWIQNKVMDKQLSYWKQKLLNIPPSLELLTDRPRPPVQTFYGAHESINLSSSLLKALQKVSAQEDATLYMTMLAAFKVMLYRYTYQEDILVGSPIANRPMAEVEDMIGLFTNTLVLRSQVEGSMSFAELLRQVRITALEAYENQDLPFEKLVEEMQPNRDLSRSPLFQVMLAYQDFSSHNFTIDGLNFELMSVDNKTSKFDLTLFVQKAEQGMTIAMEYNTDLFDQSTIQRMLSHLKIILEQLGGNPNQAIREVPMLGEQEKLQLLGEWNDSISNSKAEKSVHHMIEEQARKTPDAQALSLDGKYLTYRELNQRANQLANYLRKFGVEVDSPVGICLERSIEGIIAVLAIFKAGGAVVSLEPNFPEERLAFIINDAKVKMVLINQTLMDKVPALTSAKMICLDSEWKNIANENSDNLSNKVTMEDLAYLIYTSGSTGIPKGVAVPHLTLANLITWQTKNSALLGPIKTLQFTSLSFDVSYQEIFSTLCVGGELILVSEEVRRDSVMLLNYIDSEKIERIYLPFIALQQLAEALVNKAAPVPTHLKEVITAGEQLKVTPSIKKMFESLNNCTLHNQYGPSETHVITAMVLEDDPNDWPLLPYIGRPIDNTKVYILDNQLNPVPVGVPGVMYLAGDCLARGYLNRPDLTDEKFIVNPFDEGLNTRIYNSGDLARYHQDGQIEFLGRIDDQVKIRGYRVELGEIEALLAQHPEVQECAVVVREEVVGEKNLVAYMVTSEQDNNTDFRQYLKKLLPEYMVPFTFIKLEKIPLTGTGKVDRKSLPAPQNSPISTAMYAAPLTELERTISSIWEEVLGIEKVGVKDNFFDLGGHSLLVVKVCSKLSEEIGQVVPVLHMFRYPTIEDLVNATLHGKSEPNGREDKMARVNNRKEEQRKQRQLRQQRVQTKRKRGDQNE
ncbi:hypothetical protein GCM10008014_15540 [Paenibacillus silvae]|uniref:Carrier domain-containing protein n=1 Tax=Paenibacillus silvae TaxID=1325358 RepID=A0ABQ1Z4Z2_9BACL|nr:non-ribosomal peptide synthetase [Paenibacillus silvae]GGH50431.1 hypothetical protein GCM10008014_15540 [Paenibacillus silvae]